ncbi:MAG: hypothetical protein GX020_06115 [Firmicutes bacterium]|nr:hypothetical protein [Bacillota bacterium]
MIIGLILGFTMLGVSEVLLWQDKDPKKIFVFGVFMLIALILSVLLALDLLSPSLAELLEKIINLI